MFESAELGHAIDDKTFRQALPELRAELLEAQYAMLRAGRFPLIVLISGADGSGKGETINQLYSWMDPRHISTLAFAAPSDEEQSRPSMWRYWRALPPKGKTGIFAGSWYSQPIRERIERQISRSELEETLGEINRFEAMLVNEGALILKFWFHLSASAQKKRLRALEKNPLTAWRVSAESWRRLKTRDALQKTAGHVLRATNSAHAPWTIVEGTDDNYRSLTVGKSIAAAVRRRLAQTEASRVPVAPPLLAALDQRNLLDTLDLTQKLDKKSYAAALAKWQARLAQQVRDPRFRDKRALVVVFEGADAAGKGGAIRRLVAALDARQYQVVPIAAPSDEEQAQPYLWRFWRHAPRLGRVTVFDRSWYGRVLVERIEGFCREEDWLRAYPEINDFEQALSAAGVIVVKFWLQISKDEQLRRFKEREATPFKRFKITAEDWRNREKWDDYGTAVCDMIDRTSTGSAPWTLVEADDKNFARIKVLATVCERLARELEEKCFNPRP